MEKIHIVAFSAKAYDHDFLEQAANENTNFSCYEVALSPTTSALAKGAEVVSAFVNDDLSRDIGNSCQRKNNTHRPTLHRI